MLIVALHLHVCAAPQPLLADYTHTAWGGLQGAPVDVMKFAQTSDGWLWMATAIGLYRYDGTGFERVDGVYGQRLRSNDIIGLMATRDGALWTGYRMGGVSVFRENGARHFSEADGVAPGTVFHIEEGPDGAVWVASSGGLARLLPGAARFERLGEQVGVPVTAIYHVLFARDGTEWIGSAGGAFFRKRGAQRFAQAWPRTELMSMAEGPDGTVWASDAAGRYYRLRTTAPPPGYPLPPVVQASGLRFDREGQMWLLRKDSVERQPDRALQPLPAQRLTVSSGLSGMLAQCFFQDREGTIWIGTSSGIDRLRRNRLQQLVTRRKFEHPAMIAGPDGGVWVGDDVNPTFRFSAPDDGAGTLVDKGHFSAGYRAPDGATWIGGDDGVRRHAADGSVARFAVPEAVRGAEVQALRQDAGGGLWVAFAGGKLFRLSGGEWRPDGGLAGLASGRVMVLETDWQGRVWMGHADNRISVVAGAAGPDAGSVLRLGAEQGLALGRILSLQRDGHVMWIGGEHGTMLYRDGRFIPLRGARGESFRGVSGIARTPDGHMWLHGADGIYHVDAASLSSWLIDPARDVAFERFDAQDGLRGHASQIRPLPSLVQSADGRLWFPTSGAIAVIDPRHMHRNPLPPPAVIRGVTSGGRAYDAEDRRTLVLPQGASNLRIAFAALALSMPERTRLRYRLAGVDADWQETAGQRAATYTNLAPGTYRFALTAANEDGVWNPQPAVLDIRIPPTFFQTRPFLLLLALGAALLLYAAYALRVRAITRRLQERTEARLEERSRIARSLHDTLLQGVQGLIMSFDAHAHQMPEDSSERARLERTLGLAGRLLLDGRDQIMGLRASASPDELPRSLQAFGTELAEYGGNAFELRVAGPVVPLRAHVGEEIYAIGREALFNAARHAGAGGMLLEIEYGSDAFLLRIRDDGQGVDEAVASAGSRVGHWGLPGMRERAAAVGASFRLASRPGAGTEICVSVPAALAYRCAPRSRGRLLPWLRQRFGARAVRPASTHAPGGAAD